MHTSSACRDSLNSFLLDFERRVDLGSTAAAKLIGVAYPTYAQYRSGRRTLPHYHENHVQALLLLEINVLTRLIEEHCHGGDSQ